MANPYHDEAGRFASRDEMRGAIERLRAAGNVQAAFDLSVELSDIDGQHLQAVDPDFAPPASLLSQRQIDEITASPNAAMKYRNDVGWLANSEQFDAAVLQYAVNNHGPELVNDVARNTRSREILSKIILVYGVRGDALAEVAANPMLNEKLAVELSFRAQERLGDYPRIRTALIENPALDEALRAKLQATEPLPLPKQSGDYAKQIYAQAHDEYQGLLDADTEESWAEDRWDDVDLREIARVELEERLISARTVVDATEGNVAVLKRTGNAYYDRADRAKRLDLINTLQQQRADHRALVKR